MGPFVHGNGRCPYRVGTIKASELGGLWRSMPKTMSFALLFCPFRVFRIQRIRDEVDDFISRLRNARGLVICGAAYRIGGCCRPLRHQNPLLCILRP